MKAPATIRMEEGNAVAQFEGPAPTAGLESLAAEQNPILGFWDPLGFTSIEFSGETLEASNAWLRHAEIKHGRVAMAGFVGYIVHENGIHWPWALFNGCDYATSATLGSAPATWTAMRASGRGDALEVPDRPLRRLPRALGRVVVQPRAGRREALHARRQAGLLPDV